MARKNKNQPVSDYILDRSISHAIYLERFKSHEVASILKIYDKELIPEVEKKLTKYLGTRTVTETRIKKLAKALSSYTKSEQKILYNQLEKDMSDFATLESKRQVSMIADAAPIKLQIQTVNNKVLKSLMGKTPMQGQFVNEWFSQWGVQTSQKIIRQVRVGVGLGEGIDKITRRIIGTKSQGYKDGIVAAQRRDIKTLVRTTVANVSNGVRDQTYKQNEDIIKGYQIVATLDARTSLICISQDGKVYKIGSGIQPPFHPNCRTVTIPILKSWKELGINLKEAPATTRATMNGQVSAKKTYSQWLKGQKKSVQEDVLGKKRAALFRNSKVKVDQFVDYKGGTLTLTQLEKKYNL